MDFTELLLQLQIVALLISSAIIAVASQAKVDCAQPCGSLTIPYPFGVEGCYLNKNFLITCNHTFNPPVPFLRESNIKVENISVDGHFTIKGGVARDCYDKSGEKEIVGSQWQWLKLSDFTVSSTNKLVVIGCDSYAYLQGTRKSNNQLKPYSSGCMSTCSQKEYVDTSCSGSGCCQTEVPEGLYRANVTAYSFFNHTKVTDFNLCTYAFIVQDGKFNFKSDYLKDIPLDEEFPVVLEWRINDTEIGKVCKNHAMKTKQSENTSGYLCQCEEGYSGNPYVGCEDIDECKNPDTRCLRPENCQNEVGNYTCFCPKGYHGDGEKEGQGCIPNQSSRTALLVGVSIAISILLMIVIFVYLGIQRRSTSKLREENFKENGGLMLQQLLHSSARSAEKVRIFKEDELKKATKNFTMIIGQGGYGTVYKGTVDGKEIAIKKSKVMDRNQIDQFVNEVIVLSQINHPNVVKLIGCCLETPVPLLVSEFITNNTLHHHLHNGANGYSMSWKTRLNIAVGIADALAHMHSDAPIHIIHRDVKSANILLDDEFNAKVSDFGVSRLIPLNQSELPTLVQGTIGYLDPEYFHSGLLTEKSDVYSFGVVLAELLTGMVVLSNDRPEKDKNLAALFVCSVKSHHLFEIMDERVKKEGNLQHVKRFAEIVNDCLEMTGEKRPTMKQVKMELEEVRNENISHCKENEDYNEETQPLLRSPTNFFNAGLLLEPDSLNYQVALDIESGR